MIILDFIKKKSVKSVLILYFRYYFVSKLFFKISFIINILLLLKFSDFFKINTCESYYFQDLLYFYMFLTNVNLTYCM